MRCAEVLVNPTHIESADFESADAGSVAVASLGSTRSQPSASVPSARPPLQQPKRSKYIPLPSLPPIGPEDTAVDQTVGLVGSKVAKGSMGPKAGIDKPNADKSHKFTSTDVDDTSSDRLYGDESLFTARPPVVMGMGPPLAPPSRRQPSQAETASAAALGRMLLPQTHNWRPGKGKKIVSDRCVPYIMNSQFSVVVIWDSVIERIFTLRQVSRLLL